jgi:hypothetical protein
MLEEVGMSDLSYTALDALEQRAEAASNREMFGPNFEAEGYRNERSRELANLILKLGQELEAKRVQAGGRSIADAVFELEIDKLRREKWLIDSSFSPTERSDRARQAVFERLKRREQAKTSCDTPTTFRPLGVAVTATLLRHGYMNCMIWCNLLQKEFPRFDDPPSLDEMQQLARGISRNRYPSSLPQSLPVEARKLPSG